MFSVILAEVNLVDSKPFYGLRTNHSSAGWPFSGTSIPIKVLRAIRGPLRTDQYLNVYFFVGSSCGVTSNMLPHRNGKYLLSGELDVVLTNFRLMKLVAKTHI